MSFIEPHDFIIYQHLNTRIKILPLATFQIAHLCNEFIMFALPISMPCFKSIIFLIKIALKLSYFCKKSQNFECWGHRPQSPVPPAAGSFSPIPPSYGGRGLFPRPLKPSPHCEFLAMRHSSSMLCTILPTSIRTGFSNITFICHNIPLREQLFSSCTYQNESTKLKKSRR